jgi:imidazolonepropionase-like amidohydrolase
MEDRIGTVETGKEADLILVSGEPLADIGILADPTCIPVVIKGSEVVKDSEGRAHA